MRKIFFFVILIIITTGCKGSVSKSVYGDISDMEVKSSQEEIIELLSAQITELQNENQKLQEDNMKLKEELDDNTTHYMQENNVFDPITSKIGDSIAGFIVTNVNLNWDGHEGTYIISLAGTAEITGSYVNYLDNYIAYDKIQFEPDTDSLELIPIPEGFSSTYFIDNFEVFEKVYGVTEKGRVSMSISGLVYAVSVDKHITNRITFLNISPRNG